MNASPASSAQNVTLEPVVDLYVPSDAPTDGNSALALTTTEGSTSGYSATQQSPCSQLPASEHKFPEFPEEAYLGVGADFADLFARNYETPKEFFYFDLLMLTANSLSGVVRADFGDLKTHTRLYGLKIGPSGTSKKSTSFDMAESFVKRAWSKALGSEEDELWGEGEERSKRAFTILPGVGSAEGLLEPLNNSRVLVYFDEFDRFMKKSGAEGSVIGTAFNELFERTSYSNHTKDRSTTVQNGHLGFLSNIPLEQFESMASSGRLADLGLWNRVAYVAGDRRHRCNPPTAVSAQKLENLAGQLASYLSPYCETRETKGAKGATVKEVWPSKKEERLQLTAEAREQWAKLQELVGDGEATTRLDTIGMRLMAVLAVTSGKKEIDVEVVDAALAFLKYQKTIRERYRPSQAETREAQIEEAILKQLTRRGALTRRELQQYTNAARHGTERFKAALKALTDDQQIVLGSDQKYRLNQVQ